MIIVVEVADRRGQRASKEYDLPTLSAAMDVARQELRDFPGLRIIDVWIRRRPQQPELERTTRGEPQPMGWWHAGAADTHGESLT